MRPSKKKFPPCTDCVFLTPRPTAKGYICAALTELMCVTRGKCKFKKVREGDNGV